MLDWGASHAKYTQERPFPESGLHQTSGFSARQAPASLLSDHRQAACSPRANLVKIAVMESQAFSEIEYKLFCRAVEEACRYLAEGDAEAGCRCLRAGLERAQEFAQAGEGWAQDLARSYESALQQFGCLDVAPQPQPVPAPPRPWAGWGQAARL